MHAVGGEAVGCGGECSHGAEGVPFDAGDLDKAEDRVAGEAQGVFHAYFGGVFYLAHGAAPELRGGGSGHGDGGADFALTADLGAADGGSGDDGAAEESGGHDRSEDVFLRNVVMAVEVIENAGKDAAGTAGGSGDYVGAGCVLLAGGLGVGGDKVHVPYDAYPVVGFVF